MLVNNSMFNFYRENSFAIEFRVRGWVGGGGGGPSNFIVNQSPNPWIDLRFWIWTLRLDKI